MTEKKTPHKTESGDVVHNAEVFPAGIAADSETDTRQDRGFEGKEKSKQRKTEERFLLYFLGIIGVDALIFLFMDNLAGPVCILILELILIICAGRIYNIKDIEILTDKIFGIFDGRKARQGKGKDDED